MTTMPTHPIRALVLAAMTLAGLATQGSAATVSAFDKTSNDGVFMLTTAQIKYFGVAGATHVGFLRPSTKNVNTLFRVGTVFTAQSLLGSCKSGCTNILSVRNGANADLTYAGGHLGALTTATVTKGGSGYYAGLAFFFKGTTSVKFVGGGNFDARPTNPALNFAVPTEVPLPASLPLLAGALGLVALARRRRA